MVSAEDIANMTMTEYARFRNNFLTDTNSMRATRSEISIQIGNQERQMVATRIWGEGSSYEELRELWAMTGDEEYLERMLEKVYE